MYGKKKVSCKENAKVEKKRSSKIVISVAPESQKKESRVRYMVHIRMCFGSLVRVRSVEVVALSELIDYGMSRRGYKRTIINQSIRL